MAKNNGSENIGNTADSLIDNMLGNNLLNNSENNQNNVKENNIENKENKKKEKGYKLVSCYVSAEDYKKYQALATATGKSLSKLTGEALTQYIASCNLTAKQKKIYDAMLM